MVTKHFLTFGNLNTLDYDAWIDGSESYSGAERDYSEVEVPGRNGTVLIDNNRYKNKQIPYTAHFKSIEAMTAFKTDLYAMTGYNRLEDSHHPDEYRIAYVKGFFEPSMFGVNNRYASAKITFNCKPERWLKSGEFAISKAFSSASGGSLTAFNPSPCVATPLIHISDYTNANALTLRINSNIAATISAGTNEIYIDMDILEAYLANGSSANNVVNISQLYKGLIAGNNTIAVNRACTLEVIPRWWRL